MTPTGEKTYVVEGMSCGHCELSIKEEVEELAGVDSAEADHTIGSLVVRGADVDDTAVRGAVAAAGYRVVS